MGHVEFGYGDPYAAGADPYAAGAGVVDDVMSGARYQLAHQRATHGLMGHNRLQPPFVGSATGRPFVYEGGIASTAMTSAAPQGTATRHANIPFRIVDWMVGNPTFLSGAVAYEAFLISQIMNGETPMLMGNGGIFGSSHGPQVWDRRVGYTTTQSGWDFVWSITAQNTGAPWTAASITSLACYISFHYESHRRL